MKRSLTKIITLGLLAGLTSTAFGAMILSDTFEAGDPLDTTYVGAFNSAGTSVTSGAVLPTDYLLNDATSGFSMVRAALPADPLLNLGIGDTLTLSFDFSYAAGPDSSANGFRFGLFDASGYGSVVNAGTNTGNTTLTIVHDTTATVNPDMGSGAGGGDPFAGGSDVVSAGTMSSGIGTTAVQALFFITRTSANTVTLSTSLNGGTATVTDVDDGGDPADYLVNFSSGYLVIRSGAPKVDFAFDNVTITSSVPEPATVAFLLGSVCLLVATMRRRARR